MEPESSLPHSQKHATCPYPESARSSPYPPHLTSWSSILILSSHLRLCLPSGLFPPGFPIKTLYTPLPSPIRATWPAHPIILYFIARKLLGEEYRALSSSLCSFIHRESVRYEGLRIWCSWERDLSTRRNSNSWCGYDFLRRINLPNAAHNLQAAIGQPMHIVMNTMCTEI